ncbi:MAG: YdcF family protein [Alphaproteobacteria bacterium]
MRRRLHLFSKWAWLILRPSHFLLLSLIFSSVLGWHLATGFIALLLLTIACWPVGEWLLAKLENIYPPLNNFTLPNNITPHGVITLGGSAFIIRSLQRSIPVLGSAKERLWVMADMLRRYPHAKHIFTGGNGSLHHTEATECDIAQMFIERLGFDKSQILWENRAKNTHQNALFSHAMAQPKAEEIWVLITSASHMHRAILCFKALGWAVIPCPTDFHTGTNHTNLKNFNLSSGLLSLDHAAHEWLGLLAYWLLGRTKAILPPPQ